MAEKFDQDVLIIADRGTMDASAFIDKENWEKILARLNLEEIEISDNHLPIFKTRRCFLYGNQQYSLDIYRDPCHPRCRGLIILQTFTAVGDDEVEGFLPPFLSITKNVTGDPAFSMYNLSIRSDWTESAEQFCHRLSDDEEEQEEVYDVKEASNRLLVHVNSVPSSMRSQIAATDPGYSSDSSIEDL